MSQRVPKQLTFCRCEYDGVQSSGAPGVRLKLTTDRQETVMVIVPFDSLFCVTRSMRKGMNDYKQHIEWCSTALAENAKES